MLDPLINLLIGEITLIGHVDKTTHLPCNENDIDTIGLFVPLSIINYAYFDMTFIFFACVVSSRAKQLNAMLTRQEFR